MNGRSPQRALYPFDVEHRWGIRCAGMEKPKDMLDFVYPEILKLFADYMDPKRSESAAFLIWYLQNYYRLDPEEAVDLVCDQKGDKGIDGIFVNDDEQTITVFQARIYQSDKTMGDGALKSFAGTLGQLQTEDSVTSLMASAGAAQVASLLKRLDIAKKVATHEVKGEFLSNVDLDASGESYLKISPKITFAGRHHLKQTYISDEREPPKSQKKVSFDIAGFTVTQYTVDSDTLAIIAPVKAGELVGLDGIPDQSLYRFNVRGPLKSGVNDDIAKSIKDKPSHRFFPLFHNGITIIANKLVAPKSSGDALEIIGPYYVVNGCQSLTTLHKHQEELTDDLRILTKFI